MDIETFYLAVIDMAYNGVQVFYHRYHKAFLIRARYVYEHGSDKTKEQDHGSPDQQAREPASRD